MHILPPKSAGISNTSCCPEHIAAVVEVSGITMSICVSSAMGMIAVPGIEEWQEYLERGSA